MAGHKTWLGWSIGNAKDTLLDISFHPLSSWQSRVGGCWVGFEPVALEQLDA